MLRAILGNKSGRISIGKESISVREVYKNREDMLTAAIVSRISYLSDDTLNHLFGSIFTSSSLNFALLNEVEFWPNFTSSIQQRVEPDVILHFDWGILVIEAKRPHNSHQYAEQWINELESLPSDYQEGEICFLSLGGSATNNISELARFKALLPTYENVSIPHPTFMAYQTWEALINYLQRLKNSGDLNRSDGNIISDMIEALELYHVHANIYSLSTLKPCDIKASSLATLANTTNRLSMLEEETKDFANLSKLPPQKLYWPTSTFALHNKETGKLTSQVEALSHINERALEQWKI